MRDKPYQDEQGIWRDEMGRPILKPKEAPESPVVLEPVAEEVSTDVDEENDN